MPDFAVHPEASSDLRAAIQRAGGSQSISNSVKSAAGRAVWAAKQRLREITTNRDVLESKLRDTRKSLALAIKIQQHRLGPTQSNPFDNSGSRLVDKLEPQLIHDHFCTCKTPNGDDCFAHRHAIFRIIRDGEYDPRPEFLRGSLAPIISYFETDLNASARTSRDQVALDHYVSVTKRTVDVRTDSLQNAEKEKENLRVRSATLSKPCEDKNNNKLAQVHGSKPAALVDFLRSIPPDKVIVFSYWHETLKLIQRILQKCDVSSVFCDTGPSISLALETFTSGRVPILLLSAQSKASGANLQRANHIVILDPPGRNAKGGHALECQAVGRAVRIGQQRPVTATRFCVIGTSLEPGLTAAPLIIEKLSYTHI